MTLVKKILPVFLLSVLFLASCSPSTKTPVSSEPGGAPIETSDQASSSTPAVTGTSASDQSSANQKDLARSDDQGNVEIVITPLNLDSNSDTLEFDVSMNTHSVDLSMDLTTLATLTTDTGISVAPVRWEAPMGGHHVSGTLSFPAVEGSKPILDGANQLTLTLRNVAAPERIFTWQLTTK